MVLHKEILRYTKTVEITLQVENCRVVSIKITGDFFLYPEDAIERLEERAIGCETTECLENALLELKNAIVLGFDLVDVSTRILNAYRDLCQGP
ncbi:MAG: lipoate protein ligase C-terminal domain-containing protein [Desulfurococcaceae archaeon]